MGQRSTFSITLACCLTLSLMCSVCCPRSLPLTNHSTPLEDVMRSLASIEIDRPIDEVFTYTNEKVAEWSLTVVEDEVIEQRF